MSMQEPKVLTIIVTYDKKEYVSNLLKSLKEIDFKNYDVIVVDNASTDGTADYIEEHFPYVSVIRNSVNGGGSGGFNTGLNYAFKKYGYEYYWLLDNDVIVSKDTLEKLVEVLDKDNDIAIAGSQMCQLDNPRVTNEIGAFVNLHMGCLVLNRHMTRRSNNTTGIFNVDYVAGASMLVRANVAKRAGCWEDFFIHFDDVDWCLRIKKMGYKVVGVADSVIWHLSAMEKPVTWALYYDVRNMLFLLEKHASKKDVKRFLRRQCLHAVKLELKGLTPLAELVLDAIRDFLTGKKGKKVFNSLSGISEDEIKNTHPDRDVLVYQNEWFNVKEFPFEDRYKDSIKEIMLPGYLADARFYWRDNDPIPIKDYGKFSKLLSVIIGMLGYRKYTRSYIDFRSASCVPAFLSEELVVKINEINWLIKRDASNVRRSFSKICQKAVRYFLLHGI